MKRACAVLLGGLGIAFSMYLSIAILQKKDLSIPQSAFESVVHPRKASQ